MNTAAVLLVAFALDAWLGEPGWLWSRIPHPAAVMGRIIGRADEALNHRPGRRLKGLALVVALVVGAWALGVAIAALPGGAILSSVIAAMLIAQKSLAEHVYAVARALGGPVTAARAEVARIVGRDTAAMDESAIARAAVESAAENLSDGVIAPALWFLAFGLPGLLACKIVNTADSMIGYRTPRHESFGWAAARFDDVMMWIPARVTAALIALLSTRLGDWPAIVSDARRHRSPNAGWPEAAMARALGVALAGPRSYAGTHVDFAWVNPTGRRTAGAKDIDACVAWTWRVWTALAAIVLALALVTWCFGPTPIKPG